MVSARLVIQAGAQMTRKVSQAGIDLVKRFEGCRLRAYRDSAGVTTIGYGTTRIAGRLVSPKLTITQAEAELLLLTQLQDHWNMAERHIENPDGLTQNQVDALASFVYNVGVTSFMESTMLSFINRGQLRCAADEFLRWDKAGGKRLRGLTRRRQAERELFLKGLK